MILVEDWAEIRRLHRAEQMPIRAIARYRGISKNTVKRALASDRPPQYQRLAKGSAVGAVEVQIRELRPAYVPIDPVPPPCGRTLDGGINGFAISHNPSGTIQLHVPRPMPSSTTPHHVGHALR